MRPCCESIDDDDDGAPHGQRIDPRAAEKPLRNVAVWDRLALGIGSWTTSRGCNLAIHAPCKPKRWRVHCTCVNIRIRARNKRGSLIINDMLDVTPKQSTTRTSEHPAKTTGELENWQHAVIIPESRLFPQLGASSCAPPPPTPSFPLNSHLHSASLALGWAADRASWGLRSSPVFLSLARSVSPSVSHLASCRGPSSSRSGTYRPPGPAPLENFTEQEKKTSRPRRSFQMLKFMPVPRFSTARNGTRFFRLTSD